MTQYKDSEKVVVYGIASETLECHGHGEFGNELTIIKQGSYGCENFPPLFCTRKAAQDYLDSITFQSQKQVVELFLINK